MRYWSRVKSTDNCLSANPDDCLTWEVLGPAPVTLKVVKDTTGRDDYAAEIYPVYIKTGPAAGEYYAQRVPVLCPKHTTAQLLEQIRSALRTRGYEYQGATADVVLPALLAFQEDNNLWTGYITEESLLLLGLPDLWTIRANYEVQQHIKP